MFISADFSVCQYRAWSVGVDGWGGYPAPHASLKIPSFELMEILFPFVYLQTNWGWTRPRLAAGAVSCALMQRKATTNVVGNHFQSSTRLSAEGVRWRWRQRGQPCGRRLQGPKEEAVYVAKEFYCSNRVRSSSHASKVGGWVIR